MEEKNKENIIEMATVNEKREIASSNAPNKNNQRRWPKWVLLIAVLAIIACFGAKPAYFNYKSGQLIAQYYSPWSYDDDESNGVEGREDMVDELSELFANVGTGKDIKMTIYRLEKALKMANDDIGCYLYADEIAWYLALAYIQDNQFGSARKMLKWLMTDDESEYAEPAEELYKQIENMFFM